HSSSQIRTIAWQRFINLSGGWKDSSIWLPATKDPDKEVRQVVLNTLRGRTNDLSENELSVLVESKFSDVRIFAAQSLLNAKQDAVEALGFDLLIDEDTIVRSTTIRAMSVRRVPGWLKIMNRSLLDDNYVIQRAAMDGLLEDKKEGVPLLLDYISRNPQNRISHLARNELSKLGVQP
ncbi:MAG: HEAT repeat domain-containing protein, partial [Verrucomicrobiia bacterium]